MGGKRNSIITGILGITMAILFSHCGGGGGGGDQPVPPAQPADVAGTWTITETVNRTACGGGAAEAEAPYQITVTQSGNNITVTAGGNTFQGTVNGNVVSWTGQYYEPSEPGWVTLKSMSVTVSGNNLSGSASWDFRTTQTGSLVCSGTTNIQGVKSSTPPPSGSMTGTWNIVTTGTDNGCGGGIFGPTDVSITQTGSSLSVQGYSGAVNGSGTINGQNASWIFTYPQDNTTSIMENFAVTVSGNFNSFTGKDIWQAIRGTSVICIQADQIQGTKK